MHIQTLVYSLAKEFIKHLNYHISLVNQVWFKIEELACAIFIPRVFCEDPVVDIHAQEIMDERVIPGMLGFW